MKLPKITPEEIGIIKRAQAGDKLAFNALYKRYSPFVEKLLYRYIKDVDESRYLCNEVFLKVHEKLSMFKAYDSFGGWLRILTKNTAIDYLRHVGNKTIVTDPADIKTSSATTGITEEEVVDQISYKQLLAVLDELPKTSRKVFKLFYEDGLSVSEISKVLSIPTGTIKSTLSRTRKRIKKQLTNL